jgi:hypothetical protein
MARLVVKLALTTAAFALLPATAAAAVDEKTGPVAFANVASVSVVGGGSVITETQRSPRARGVSELSQDRVAVPKDDSERTALGAGYLLRFGKFDEGPFPGTREHHVAASLAEDGVPSAVAETSFALQDTGRAGDRTVVALEDAKTEVSCPGANGLSGDVSAARLWVRGADDVLSEVALPQDSVVVTGVKLGPPGAIADIDEAATTSDLTISRVHTFDQLLRQDEWRGGDLTVVAGWRIEVVTHVVRTGSARQDVTTQIVLGGVSCSIPRDFVPATPAIEEDAVPLKIPSGGGPAGEGHFFVEASAREAGNRPLGFALTGGGVLLAAVAVAVWRRKGAR